MIYSLSGKLILKNPQFAVIEASGIGFKVITSSKASKNLPKIGSKTKIFCYTNVKQDGIEIFGFLDEKELKIFELINSISGIGPKSAIAILGKLNYEKFLAAVTNKRADLIAEISGIGRKKAERIILELKDKIKASGSMSIEEIDSEKDLKSVLKNLGYKQKEIEEALDNIPQSAKKIEEKLKFSIKFLSKK